ncbi:hypothetical protein [Sediminibacterium goheungense]|uniref:hypothetical protein n=1 Tax=Sediminibacterium goheungense TaxID=1086393 RepID=UPI001060D2C5|nr:hypothetical protein [Sediminibacterium goheungense]
MVGFSGQVHFSSFTYLLLDSPTEALAQVISDFQQIYLGALAHHSFSDGGLFISGTSLNFGGLQRTGPFFIFYIFITGFTNRSLGAGDF